MPNGSTYVQVVDKSSGKYKVVKSFGSFKSDSEKKLLLEQAQEWITHHQGSNEFDFTGTDIYVDQFFDSITSMKRVGYDLLLGKLFDEVGFNKIKSTFFRELVLARVAFPKAS